MFKAGDVVVGPFAGKDRVIHHQSVVIGEMSLRGQDFAVLVYTTSKENGSSYGGKFLPEDLHLAGWSNGC
ncbi:hypothetical protein, partial [Vibrio vulnificus]|uniref:hypothetical protein n=1 Tax=Vibrio vulnificus TaxID=672 RepID=UPI0039B57342